LQELVAGRCWGADADLAGFRLLSMEDGADTWKPDWLLDPHRAVLSSTNPDHDPHKHDQQHYNPSSPLNDLGAFTLFISRNLHASYFMASNENRRMS
jgi:hypothetical protein